MANPGAYGVGRSRRVIEDPFNQRVSLGLISGVTLVGIIGHNPDVDTGTLPEDCWEEGGSYAFLAVASSLEVLSSSANDTSAGSGARTILVTGLDTNYNPLSETVILNGTSVVALSGSYLRVNAMQVATAGSTTTNEGTITLRVASAGASVSVMGPGDGLAQNGIYTVPAGFKFIPEFFTCSALKAPADSTSLAVRYRPFGGAFFVIQQFGLNSQGSTALSFSIPLARPVTEKTDIRFTVTEVSANNVAVSASLLGKLFPNSYQGTFS